MKLEMINDGGPVFPHPSGDRSIGLTRRDWFAAHAPEPTQDQIKYLSDFDTIANPHGESHKPKRRSVAEIVADIRFAYADAMIAGSQRSPR